MEIFLDFHFCWVIKAATRGSHRVAGRAPLASRPAAENSITSLAVEEMQLEDFDFSLSEKCP